MTMGHTAINTLATPRWQILDSAEGLITNLLNVGLATRFIKRSLSTGMLYQTRCAAHTDYYQYFTNLDKRLHC